MKANNMTKNNSEKVKTFEIECAGRRGMRQMTETLTFYIVLLHNGQREATLVRWRDKSKGLRAFAASCRRRYSFW